MPPTVPIRSPIDPCNPTRLGALWGIKNMSAPMRRTLLAPVLSTLLLLACQNTASGPGLNADTIAVTPLAAPGTAPGTTPGTTPGLTSGTTSGTTSVEGAEAATVQIAAAATPHPKLRPDALRATAQTTAMPATGTHAATDPAAVEPAAPKSAEQVLCEKSKGQWASAGDTGANYCASLTRDGGKQCHKKTDCQGQCLARSGTCSPIAPLYGCNDIFEKDGRMVTLCIN